MKTKGSNATRFTLIAVLGLLLGFSPSATADWNPGDPYKMHFPQLPDPLGWDVNFTTPAIVADDWKCTETGPVADIHFWFSYHQDIIAPLATVKVSIHSDVPVGPNNPFSHPGELLWARSFTAEEFTVRDYGTGQQGWFDPQSNLAIRPDHFRFFQVNIQNIVDPFIQQQDNIYWLDLSVATLTPSSVVGWKTSRDHFNDDAVWADYDSAGNLIWRELRDPLNPEISLDMAFVITVPEPGTWLLMGIGAAALGIWARSRRSRS